MTLCDSSSGGGGSDSSKMATCASSRTQEHFASANDMWRNCSHWKQWQQQCSGPQGFLLGSW